MHVFVQQAVKAQQPLPCSLLSYYIVSTSANAQGYVDRDTGIAELEFIAEFVLTVGPLYKVCTCLRFESGTCARVPSKSSLLLQILASAKV